MMMKTTAGLFFSSLLLAGVVVVVRAQDGEGYDLVDQSASSRPSTEPAEYACVFENKWTSDSHPTDYPESTGDNPPQWLRPVVVSHSDAFVLFEPNELASTGIELYSTSGQPQSLLLEIVQDNPNDGSIGDVSTVETLLLDGQNTGIDIESVKVDTDRPFVSLVSKIEPSPDFFAGLNGFDMRDPTTGNWLEDVTLDLYPFDAGVYAGDSYITTIDVVENPPLPITQLSTGSVFENPELGTVSPVAELRCLLSTDVPTDQVGTSTSQPTTDGTTGTATDTPTSPATTAGPTSPSTTAGPTSPATTAGPTSPATTAGPTSASTTVSPTTPDPAAVETQMPTQMQPPPTATMAGSTAAETEIPTDSSTTSVPSSLRTVSPTVEDTVPAGDDAETDIPTDTATTVTDVPTEIMSEQPTDPPALDVGPPALDLSGGGGGGGGGDDGTTETSESDSPDEDPPFELPEDFTSSATAMKVLLPLLSSLLAALFL